MAQHAAASKRLLRYLPAHEGALRETRSFIERHLRSDEGVQTTQPYSRKNSSLQDIASRMKAIEEAEGDPRMSGAKVNADGSRSVGC